jgi:hypothetical protein
MATIGNVISISPDITYLDVQVVFDISGVTPIIDLTNASQGPNLQNITYWFTVTAPDGTPIHSGSFATPDEVGVWTTGQITDSWPMPYNQIIWSGPPYLFSVFAQDSVGNVFEVDKSAIICRPQGNTNLSLNTLGAGCVVVEVVCEQASVFFQDQTNTSYQGQAGVQQSSLLIVAYPVDQTNTPPPPFSMGNFATCLVPISYSSSNYQFTYYSIYQYNQNNNVYVNVGYRQQQSFSVLCNIDMGPLVCSLAALVEELENGTCSNVAATNSKLIRLNAVINSIFIGIKQPLLGVDVPKLIKRGADIAGLPCDCIIPGTAGLAQQTGSVIGGFNFTVGSTCGDIAGNFAPVGNNIVLNLSDKSYIFNTSPSIPTTAFTILPSLTGCVKTYLLNVSLPTLANDLLDQISTNAILKDLFNTIVNPATNQTIVVNGKCIFQSTNTYSYTYTLLGIPATTTFAQLISIVNNGTSVPLNFAFNQTNIPALQTYLNSLNIGVWTATNVTGTVTLSSVNNTAILTNLTYALGASQFQASLTTTSTGFAPVTTEFVIQAIINYLSGLTEENVSLALPYNVPTIVTNTAGTGYQAGTIAVAASEGCDPTSNLQTLLQAFISAENAVINYVLGLGAVNCATLTALFQGNTNLLSNQSLLYGTKTVAANGQNPSSQACAGITVAELFQYMLQNVNDPTTNELFCTRVQACGAGQPCIPFNNLTVSVVPHNTVCTNIVGLSGTFS